MALILVIDNYDSFTYNLVQMLEAMGETCLVIRNDARPVAELLALQPDRVVISPGPGRPESAGVSVELVASAPEELPVLGVCLGHQAIGVAFGASVEPAVRLMHGKADDIRHDGGGLLDGVPSPFRGGRYHSLAVSDVRGTPLRVEAVADDGTIMAVRHAARPVFGIQFHPESVLTPVGDRILQNFCRVPGGSWTRDAKEGAAHAGHL
ncbi:MAG: anthranilate synthase component II, partial [Clostridia bacterium]